MAETLPRARLAAEWLAILLFTALLVAWAQTSGITGRLDSAILDRIVVHDASPASDDVLLVTIDDRSLQAEGQWPWDRRKVAALIDRIDTAAPGAILLDILYTEPSDPVADSTLADSLRRSGKVALPHGMVAAANRIDGIEAVPPIPGLLSATLVTGHVGVTPDSDGTIRRIALTLPDRNEGASATPHVILALFGRLHDRPAAIGEQSRTGLALHLRPSGSYRAVPAAAVLAGEVPAEFIRGKLVIIGATAQGLGDNFPVSNSAGLMMSGSELQANLYQNLGEGDFVSDLGGGAALAISLMVILALFIAFWALRPVWCLAVAVALALIALALSYFLAVSSQVWFAPGPLVLGLMVAHPLWGWRRLSAINDYLIVKADRLALADGRSEKSSAKGFDSVARAVSRLDFLVDEISERRAFLRRVVESTPDALCVFDADGKLMMMNQRTRAIIGEVSQGSEGLTVAELLERVGGQLDDDWNELTLRDGSIFVITRSTGLPEEHWPEIQLAMFTDVTAQRRAEDERRQALEFLSHDMRSPQVAILGLTSDREHKDSEAERLARVRGHARRTLDLADDFVHLARLGETPLDIELLDFGMMAEESADRAFGHAKEAGAGIDVIAPSEPLFVEVDGQVFSRVLDNLVGNAIKYGAKQVTVTISQQSDHARLVVEDNGPGLPAERLADPFRRFGALSGERKGGSGLGLAFVSGAIERHGGRVSCSSSPGEGTRFEIEVPMISGA